MKKLIVSILDKLGYTIAKKKPATPVPSFSGLWFDITIDARELISPYLAFSKSQYSQDLFVVSQTGARTGGFFVEFGATDGVRLSNSWILEKKLGWSGILAEPARVWHADLAKNRGCAIDRRCVTDTSGQFVEFLETGNPTDQFEVSSPELSSMAKYANSGDWASKIRVQNSIKYEVETISLNDLLDQHGAPPVIDYMSIDTEGSELLILRGFDFSVRKIRILTVEHNHDEATRQALYELLTKQGYSRVHPDISAADDWYVLSGAAGR